MNIQQKFLTKNQYSRPGTKLKSVKGIVVHWVAANNQKAINTWGFFENRKNGKSSFGSAHFIVGQQGEIIQCIPIPTTVTSTDGEIAYHVGSKTYPDKAIQKLGSYPNSTTIGIEMANIDMNGNMNPATYQSTVKLVAHLLKKYNLTVNDIWRHYDVVGWKDCPRLFVKQPDKYEQFKRDVQKEMNLQPVITKEQIIKEVIKMLQSKHFKDFPENMEWAMDAADRCYERGIIAGDGKGNLNPEENMKRGELVVVADRIVEYLLKELGGK